MATLLSLSPSSRQVIEQIEIENRTIQRQVNSYVEEELDALEKQTKKACRSFDEAREELISERNRLQRTRIPRIDSVHDEQPPSRKRSHRLSI